MHYLTKAIQLIVCLDVFPGGTSKQDPNWHVEIFRRFFEWLRSKYGKSEGSRDGLSSRQMPDNAEKQAPLQEFLLPICSNQFLSSRAKFRP